MNTPLSSKVVATVADADAKAGSVVLRGVTVGLDTAVGHAFVVDCARNIEGLMLDHDIKTKYELSDEDSSDWPLTRPYFERLGRRASAEYFTGRHRETRHGDILPKRLRCSVTF